jgi:hypothetical protein
MSIIATMKHLLLLSAIGLATQSSLVAGQVLQAQYIDTNGEIKSVEGTPYTIQQDGSGEVMVPRMMRPVCGDGDESCKAPVDEEPIAAAEESIAAPEEGNSVAEDSTCPSRPQVVRCASKYLDTDQNGASEREELDSAMKGVSWIVRGLLKVIGSTDSIMKKCDADGDGKITIEQDMEATKETCLATCFKRKAFKQLFFPECTE